MKRKHTTRIHMTASRMLINGTEQDVKPKHLAEVMLILLFPIGE